MNFRLSIHSMAVAMVFALCFGGTSQAKVPANPGPSPTISTALPAPAMVAGQPGKNTSEKEAQEVVNMKVENDKMHKEIEKLLFDIDNLKANNENLEQNNKALGPITRFVTPWLSSLGGLFAVFAGAILGYFLNREFNNTQRQKLDQERELEREKHIMELFKNLGGKGIRLQLAAASMLTQRLESLHLREPDLNVAEQLEKKTIIQVLIAITKKTTSINPQTPHFLNLSPIIWSRR